MIVESVFLASEYESMKHINTSTSDKYIKFCFVLFLNLMQFKLSLCWNQRCANVSNAVLENRTMWTTSVIPSEIAGLYKTMYRKYHWPVREHHDGRLKESSLPAVLQLSWRKAISAAKQKQRGSIH